MKKQQIIDEIIRLEDKYEHIWMSSPMGANDRTYTGTQRVWHDSHRAACKTFKRDLTAVLCKTGRVVKKRKESPVYVERIYIIYDNCAIEQRLDEYTGAVLQENIYKKGTTGYVVAKYRYSVNLPGNWEIDENPDNSTKEQENEKDKQ